MGKARADVVGDGGAGCEHGYTLIDVAAGSLAERTQIVQSIIERDPAVRRDVP